jgi:hypothetical protein
MSAVRSPTSPITEPPSNPSELRGNRPENAEVDNTQRTFEDGHFKD